MPGQTTEIDFRQDCGHKFLAYWVPLGKQQPSGDSAMTSSWSYSCLKQKAVIWYRAFFKCFLIRIGKELRKGKHEEQLAVAGAFTSLSIGQLVSGMTFNFHQFNFIPKVISLSIKSWTELTPSLYEVLIRWSKSKASANQVRNIPQITQNLNTSIMLKVRIID